jgi:F-box interacting protein
MSANKVSWDFLPGEIVTQILLRLPIKSIITSICVCKTWKSIIQNPTFISTHLHHSTTTNHLLLFSISSCSEQIYALHNDDDNDFTEHTRFDFLVDSFTINPIFRVVATCNGLFCFSNDRPGYGHPNQFYLWNPCVRKYVKLPYPNVTFEIRDGIFHSIGFGFDPKTNDYKVVRMVSLWDDPDCKDRPKVEVYTLSTGEWRTVTPVLSPLCILHDCPTPAFVNGALHWIGFRRNGDQFRYFVLVFDLGDEVFREIPLTELQLGSGVRFRYNPEEDWIQLSAVYGNSIALFHATYFHAIIELIFLKIKRVVVINIWVIKEYGVASSWTKVFTITDQDPDMPFAIGFRRNGEFVLQVESGQLISVDVGNQKMKDLGISSDKNAFVDSYVESLVLLDKAANGAVTY